MSRDLSLSRATISRDLAPPALLRPSPLARSRERALRLNGRTAFSRDLGPPLPFLAFPARYSGPPYRHVRSREIVTLFYGRCRGTLAPSFLPSFTPLSFRLSSPTLIPLPPNDVSRDHTVFSTGSLARFQHPHKLRLVPRSLLLPALHESLARSPCVSMDALARFTPPFPRYPFPPSRRLNSRETSALFNGRSREISVPLLILPRQVSRDLYASQRDPRGILTLLYVNSREIPFPSRCLPFPTALARFKVEEGN